jgi:hypothetical protein
MAETDNFYAYEAGLYLATTAMSQVGRHHRANSTHIAVVAGGAMKTPLRGIYCSEGLIGSPEVEIPSEVGSAPPADMQDPAPAHNVVSLRYN